MPPSFRSAERHLVRFAGENDRGEKIGVGRADRKSTRLNSSHSQISYAVFCLKKKKIKMEKLVVVSRISYESPSNTPRVARCSTCYRACTISRVVSPLHYPGVYSRHVVTIVL